MMRFHRHRYEAFAIGGHYESWTGPRTIVRKRCVVCGHTITVNELGHYGSINQFNGKVEVSDVRAIH